MGAWTASSAVSAVAKDGTRQRDWCGPPTCSIALRIARQVSKYMKGLRVHQSWGTKGIRPHRPAVV